MEPDGRAGIIKGCAVLCWCVSVGLVAGGPTQRPFFLCPRRSRGGGGAAGLCPSLPARWWWWLSSDGDGRTGGGGSPCLVGWSWAGSTSVGRTIPLCPRAYRPTPIAITLMAI